MQTKSVKSVSMPDELWTDLDNRSKKWGGNRSAAITRIYLEWLEMTHPQTSASNGNSKFKELSAIAA